MRGFPVERFIQQYADRVQGTLSGFDRVLFRGNCGSLHYTDGMARFLSSQGVLLKDFKAYALKLTDRLKEAAEEHARSAGRPFQYVASPRLLKEEIAEEIAERDGILEGLVCVLRCSEPCRSYGIRYDENRKLKLVMEDRKCLFLYFYFMDREFGLMHVRLQTWLPFTIQICLNGREYLARAMDAAGISYTKADNCFTVIADLPRAQVLLDRLTTRNWERTLDVFARRVNPFLTATEGLHLYGYSWTLRQSEWATDVLFRDPESLAALYPALSRYAIDHFRSEDLLRFFGHKSTRADHTSHYGHRFEGLRVKHTVYENSIKMYDKRGSVLRIETTINNPSRFTLERGKGRDGKLRRLPMRKGLADLPARARLCQEANLRYLDALAVVDLPTRVDRVLDPLHERVVHGKRSYRPLRPISPDDSSLLAAVGDALFLLDGLSNAELRKRLPANTSRQVSRKLALLCAHGLIQRQGSKHRYQLTERGRTVASTSILVRNASLARLAA
jgi:hypothetical protein